MIHLKGSSSRTVLTELFFILSHTGLEHSAFATKHYLWPRSYTGVLWASGNKIQIHKSLLLPIRAIYLQLTRSTHIVSCKRFSELWGGFTPVHERFKIIRIYLNMITFLSPGLARTEKHIWKHMNNIWTCPASFKCFSFFLFLHFWFEWISLCQAWQRSDHYQRKILSVHGSQAQCL